MSHQRVCNDAPAPLRKRPWTVGEASFFVAGEMPGTFVDIVRGRQGSSLLQSAPSAINPLDMHGSKRKQYGYKRHSSQHRDSQATPLFLRASCLNASERRGSSAAFPLKSWPNKVTKTPDRWSFLPARTVSGKQRRCHTFWFAFGTQSAWEDVAWLSRCSQKSGAFTAVLVSLSSVHMGASCG